MPSRKGICTDEEQLYANSKPHLVTHVTMLDPGEGCSGSMEERQDKEQSGTQADIAGSGKPARFMPSATRDPQGD